MNKKRLWILCIITIITISIVTGKKVKSSFIEIPTFAEEIKANPTVSYSWHEDEILRATYPYYSYDINNLNDLEKQSHFIAEVMPIDDGTLVAYATLRKCKVINTFKGKSIDENIYIYEPNIFMHTDNYICEQGYISMKKDEKYIVFLKNIENSDRVSDEKLRNGYLYTNPTFGKYKLGEKAKLIERNPDKDEMHFNEVIDLPVFLIENENVEKYNCILGDIEKTY